MTIRARDVCSQDNTHTTKPGQQVAVTIAQNDILPAVPLHCTSHLSHACNTKNATLDEPQRSNPCMQAWVNENTYSATRQTLPLESIKRTAPRTTIGPIPQRCQKTCRNHRHRYKQTATDAADASLEPLGSTKKQQPYHNSRADHGKPNPQVQSPTQQPATGQDSTPDGSAAEQDNWQAHSPPLAPPARGPAPPHNS